jgi:hypothetical protein
MLFWIWVRVFKSFYELVWRKGAKDVKLVVGYALLVDVSVHGGMLTMADSWWGENVITQKKKTGRHKKSSSSNSTSI